MALCKEQPPQRRVVTLELEVPAQGPEDVFKLDPTPETDTPDVQVSYYTSLCFIKISNTSFLYM